MKVDSECAACILNKTVLELKEATENSALRFRSVIEILRLLKNEFKINTVPANLGTKREDIIKRITGNNDPYKNIKRKSNKNALKLLPYIKKLFEDSYTQKDRFKKAALFSIVGNTIPRIRCNTEIHSLYERYCHYFCGWYVERNSLGV